MNKEEAKESELTIGESLIKEESKGVQLFGHKCLYEKAKEIEDFIGKLIFMQVENMSYGDYKVILQQQASNLINNIIIPTQDEPDRYFWEGVDEKISSKFISNIE